MAGREQGVIIAWSDREGRGVIRCDEGSEVEFSFSDIRQVPGSYLGIAEGSRVTFLLVNTEVGLRASEISYK